MAITEEQIFLVNKTSRNTVAFGANAIVPVYVETIARKDDTILDFGAGKDAIHTKRLIEKGYNVTAYDFGINDTAYHDSQALQYSYDIVMVSNVINVQLNAEMLRNALDQIWCSTKGVAIMNYPLSPRKGEYTTEQMLDIIEDYFDVRRVGGTAKAPIWQCSEIQRHSRI